jgi:diaminopimelate decarboxylase
VDSRFRLSEDQAVALAKQFETPLYVIDEQSFRTKIRNYVKAFESQYPKSKLSYASKANSTLAVIKLAYEEGLTIDIASEGEFRAALLAGVKPADCHFHGNNKQYSELEFALEQGIGMIVIDHFEEIEMIRLLRHAIHNNSTQYVLRLAPGVDPKTHKSISTGQADTKFGFNIADGSAEQALLKCQKAGLKVIGFHCHVGSQLIDPEAQVNGGKFLAEFAAEMREKHGFETAYLNVGGGLGAKYVDEDQPKQPEEYCKLLLQALKPSLDSANLEPTLAQEPGRSLIAESGVTLYTIGVIKTVPKSDTETRTFISVDGGLSDNPRPVMYQAKYSVERIARSNRLWEYTTDGPGAVMSFPSMTMKKYTVSGKHCETDTLFENIELPADVERGDLLQVLTTGAYNSSMASNYNRYPRPATVMIRENGDFEIVVRRENWDDLFSKELQVND